MSSIKYACRFCRHGIDNHNGMVGCEFCRCMGTRGEAFPETDEELEVRPLPSGLYAEGYRPEPESPKKTAINTVNHAYLQRKDDFRTFSNELSDLRLKGWQVMSSGSVPIPTTDGGTTIFWAMLELIDG